MAQKAADLETEYGVYQTLEDNPDKAFKAARDEGGDDEFVLYLYMDEGEFVASIRSNGIFGNEPDAGTVLDTEGEDASKNTGFEELDSKELVDVADVPSDLRDGE